MNNNSFGQIQNLLAQVSNYVAKINEIIFQINNIINSQNQMNGMMMQMNMMNNMMNFQNNFNNDLNPLLNDQPLELDNKMINVVFHYRGNPILIPAQEYLPLTEVINRFLQKIDKPELVDNYQKKIKFLYNAQELDNSKKVGEISQNKLFRIQVYDLQDLY
jgi:hypothetical protein